MRFASLFQAWPDCAFADMTFRSDAATLAHLATLYPLPDKLHSAVLKRQVEFLAGRVCAQQALARLTGRPPALIPAREDRAPAWPASIVGAITHTAGYAAALVAPGSAYDGIGIDCEQVMAPEQLPLQRHICVPYELDSLQEQPGAWPPEALLSLIFSAKESLFKGLYPRVQTYFGFHAARVTAVDFARQTFIIQLVDDLHPAWRTGASWEGRFGRQDRFLMTAIVVPQERPNFLACDRPGTSPCQKPRP
ncbi:MAG: 4'-phosphopantetheinyl transferase [Candidatus Tectimicrobiota bacterium]